jgi:hypothetical protein
MLGGLAFCKGFLRENIGRFCAEFMYEIILRNDFSHYKMKAYCMYNAIQKVKK